MSWLTVLVPPPSTRRLLTLQSFVLDFLPPLLCYYVTALLVLLPNTILFRLALLPITLWTAFRAATSLDLALGYDEKEGLAYLNHGLLLAMLTLSMRAIAWTFRRKPYRRGNLQSAAGKIAYPRKDASNVISVNSRSVIWDALDLFFNLRGWGWDWSEGLQVAPETRTTSSKFAFLVPTFMSAVVHLVVFDTLHYGVQAFSPLTIGSASGGSIFDASLPPFLRYFRSSTICLCAGLTIYCAIQTTYDIATIIGVLIFRQYPAQWPPIFDVPWQATSLNEFWAKRWHQLFRFQFISVGAKPLHFLVGRIGGVMGAFLMSGILHDFGMWGMGKGSEFWSVGGYFLIMGVGVIMEATWKNVTGYRVGGWFGRVWTAIWVVGWANLIVDAWCRRGLVGSIFMADSVRPSTYLVGLIS